MKALSVRQPWAWLIVNGHKTVENRSWRTNHRGDLLIHVSQTIEREAIKDLQRANPDVLTKADLDEMRITGVVLGVVDVVDCTLTPTDDDDVSWHEPGQWAWVLRNPRLLVEPIPAKGKLKLFDVPIPDSLEVLEILGADSQD